MKTTDKTLVSVVIGSYNRRDYLEPTIASVRRELAKVTHEIIVVDGGSDDGTLHWLIEQKDVITILQHNRGQWNGKPIERKSWGYFMNLGFRAASGKYVCMLSDDCLVVPGAITKGLKLFESVLKAGRRVGGVAFYWRNWPKQEKYWVGLAWGNRMFVNHGLYLRQALEAVNFIDADNYHFYHADGDLGLRMADEGFETIDSPDSYIEHHAHANTEVRQSNLEKQKQDWSYYENRWQHLGKPERDWIEKDFRDKHHTTEKYWDKLK